ncbi:glycosyltransferase [Myroides odoratus]|uniref:glycosyltransferase n=1 Tax=Myroides odoratus TaxID=256 RepID=UPI00333FF591
MRHNRMLVISSLNPDLTDVNGVAKKIMLEINTFKSFGYQVDFVEISDKGVYINSYGIKNFCVQWSNSYHNTFANFYRYLKSKDQLDYDIVYFRYEHISFSMLNFFKKFKRLENKLVIGELPTFMNKPYSNDSLKNKLSFYIKRGLNLFLPKKIDFIVTFSEHKRLFRANTINIENFSEIEGLEVKKINTTPKNECHLLVLAQLTPAHGVDLVIRGLKEYYKKENTIKCFLHIVGNGSIQNSLKEEVLQLDLNSYVSFYGALGGESLNEVFDKCDIGIGALAIFRKGSYKLSELKIREYTARGLPFVYNAYEPQIQDCFFGFKIASVDEPTDIDKIVKFYSGFDYNQENLMLMRNFAKENFSAKKQLGIVNNVINEWFKI